MWPGGWACWYSTVGCCRTACCCSAKRRRLYPCSSRKAVLLVCRTQVPGGCDRPASLPGRAWKWLGSRCCRGCSGCSNSRRAAAAEQKPAAHSPSAPSLLDSSESLLPGAAGAGVATTVAMVTGSTGRAGSRQAVAAGKQQRRRSASEESQSKSTTGRSSCTTGLATKAYKRCTEACARWPRHATWRVVVQVELPGETACSLQGRMPGCATQTAPHLRTRSGTWVEGQTGPSSNCRHKGTQQHPGKSSAARAGADARLEQTKHHPNKAGSHPAGCSRGQAGQTKVASAGQQQELKLQRPTGCPSAPTGWQHDQLGPGK